MDCKQTKRMTPFDLLTTPAHLYQLKLFLPYLPRSMQRSFAVYIKFLELRYTLDEFHGFPTASFGLHITSELKDYMEPEEKERLEQLENLMHMLEMLQAMNDSEHPGTAANPLDLLMGMLTPEQQESFSMYSSMFEQTMNESEKGESEHE